MWAVGKTGAAGSCCGHLSGQLDLGTVRPTLIFNTDGFCRREFLFSLHLFSLLPWCHEMRFWETSSFGLLLPTQLLPGKEQCRGAASVIYRGCSILGQSTHI